MEFKNLRRYDNKEKEIIRSLLNNGVFTIAHNWSPEDKKDFIAVFKKFDASPRLISEIIEMFNLLSDYTYFNKHSYHVSNPEYAEDNAESAWENMVSTSKHIEDMMKKEDIWNKMSKHINW